MAGGLQDQARLARDRNDGKQSATRRDVGLSAAALRFRHRPAVVMLMRRSVGMHMDLAAVVVHGSAVIVRGSGNMILDQAVCDHRIAGERESGGWRKNAQRIE